jgi:hypothetical protein
MTKLPARPSTYFAIFSLFVIVPLLALMPVPIGIKVVAIAMAFIVWIVLLFAIARRGPQSSRTLAE